MEHVNWAYWVSDDRYGSRSGWRDYPARCSAQLNKAFSEGKASVRLTLNDKSVIVDFLDMMQRHVDSNLPPTPVFARGKLYENFDIQKVFAAEKELRRGNSEHQQILVGLLTLLKMKQPTPSSELIYSALSLMLRVISLDGMVDVFVMVRLSLDK